MRRLHGTCPAAIDGDGVLVNDDGGEEDGGGGRIAAIDRHGKVSVLLGPDKLLPDVGMDVAPSDFGDFGGQIFILTQPLAGDKGLWVAHQISHINLQNGRPEILCKLPPAGQAGQSVAGAGSAARFGPAGGPFARKLFAVTTMNHMIYQPRQTDSVPRSPTWENWAYPWT